MTKQEFADWMTRNGYRVKDAAERLGLTPLSVKRMKAGTQAVTRQTAMLVEKDEAARLVTDADVDMAATLADVADTCALVPFSVVTGVTAAVLRGWTTANVHVQFVALPPHPARFRMPGEEIVALPDPLLPERVELHRDRDGRWFRIADPVRTVVDAIRFDEEQVRFHVEEVVRSAVSAGVTVSDLLDFAAKHGPETVAKLEGYLERIGQDLIRQWRADRAHAELERVKRMFAPQETAG